MPLSSECITVTVAARSSPLSKAQVVEVQREIEKFRPEIAFSIHYVETMGDRDLVSSLRGREKSDFFTREIDQLLLSQKCSIAIHSAKDLPDPLPKGLAIIALTKGVDPSDALVFRDGESIENLPTGALVATSSERREEAVKLIRSDLSFVDIRGNIAQRLEKLWSREVDAVVIAEAALIRLQLTHLSRLTLPAPTVEGQGQLAIVAREEDEAMRLLFAPLDTR